MSNEQRRREAIRAVADLGSASAFAFPVERILPEGPLLLVLHADDEHLAVAIDAVLSVDPEAEAVLSRVLFADTMHITLSEHRVPSVVHNVLVDRAFPKQPRRVATRCGPAQPRPKPDALGHAVKQ
jgi:hypothetical protein